MRSIPLAVSLTFLLVAGQSARSDDAPKVKKKIILVAGKKSHGPIGNGMHDYGWSVRLLKVMLDHSNIKDQVEVEAYLDDGPGDLRVYDKADTIMIVSDGRDGNQYAEAPHLASPERVRYFDALMRKGCGFITFHFSTFTPDQYAEQILNWSGGYFKWEEDGKRKWYSAIRTLEDTIQLGSADHPIVRGIKPFKMREEFYYNIRFKPKDESLQPIFVVPAIKGREPDGNIVAWARVRSGGGRGFGTTCGHFYDNWKNDYFRKTMLNALAWTAKVEVPPQGVEARFFTHEEINKILGEYPAAAPAPEKKPPSAAQKADSLRVLLLAGNDQHKWHNWEKTTPAIKQLLERDPRIKVDVSLDIEDLAKKPLADYQVIVQNYVNWHDPRGLSEAARQAFVRFLQNGGGLVVVHFANGAFHSSLPETNGFDWPEYRKMVRRVWNHAPSEGKPRSGHDNFGRFTVRITDVKHAITAGLKAFDVSDELYFHQDGEAAIEPLIMAESKITKKLEPLAWTGAYGKGRVFQTLLGHSEKTYESHEPREMLRRAVAWAAGREIIPLDPGKDNGASAPTKKGNHFGNDSVGFSWNENDSRDDRWKDSQIGRFLASALPLPMGRGMIHKGLSVRLGKQREATVCYDTELLKLRAAWTDGFLQFTPARFGLISPPHIAGTTLFLADPSNGWQQAKTHYIGLHAHGERIVLSYRVTPLQQNTPITVRETPWLIAGDGIHAITRTLEVGPATVPLTMQLAEAPGAALRRQGESEFAWIRLEDKQDSLTTALAVIGPGVKLAAENGKVTLTIPARAGPLRFTVLMSTVRAEDLAKLANLSRRDEAQQEAAFDFPRALQPGPPRWTTPIVTKGIVAPDNGPYVVDTLTLPFENPYKALLFVSGHDFFATGDLAVCTVHGDVWRVGGVNGALNQVTWKRYATGLFQPLGLKVIADKVYVLGRDQITRLHDANGDGEADFYENFCNLPRTSPDGHDYSTCLETDAAGNFYFLSARDGLLRVSADGRNIDTVATGFRNPNGLGIGPGDVITVSPQEGNWTPASNITEVRPGGYYGYGGPRVTAGRPLGYDPPLCWIPRRQDNSSGGQVWVTSKRWGPLEGHLLHLSFGQCRMMLVLREKLDPPALGGSALVQGGVIDLPHVFASGVMRGRFSPHDGQLYVSGLKGWVCAASQDGCLQRVRYTGRPVHLPVRVRSMKNGLAISFTRPLDRHAAEDLDNFHVRQWGYRYAADYGSTELKASNPRQEGHDDVEIGSASLLDERTVFLEIPQLKPAMQTAIGYTLKTSAGVALKQTIHYTLHATGPETMDPTKLVRKPQPGRLSPAVEAALLPGLRTRFEQNRRHDTRVSRLAALHVPAGSVPTPFLDPASFRAEFRGFLKTPLRGEVAFSLRGRGEATLCINGKKVLSGDGDLATTAPARIVLHRGYNALALDYRSPPHGDAVLRLYWEGEDWPLEPVPPQFLFAAGEDKELSAGSRLRRGRELFATLHCGRCHGLPQETSAMPELTGTGPDLASAGTSLHPEWIMHWLLDPHRVRNHFTMPKLLDGRDGTARQKAADLAAFLDSLKPAQELKEVVGNPATGRNLFEDLNCIVCHRLTAPEAKDEYDRTTLQFVSAKFRAGALQAFLLSPHAHHAAGRMPDFHLSHDESAALTAFLRAEAHATIPRPPELDRADAQRGRELFRTLRCANCHATAAETPPVVSAMPLKNTDEGCLGAVPARRGSAPDFSLPDRDRAALAAFVRTDRQALVRRVPSEESRRLVAALRCAQCHGRDGVLSPNWTILADEGRGISPESLPHLTHAGEKLRPDWLARFLAGRVPYAVRPYLKSRMPSFPAHAAILAEGLASEHGLGYEPPHPPHDLALAKIGNQLTFKTALDCRQCHPVGREKILGDDKTQISPGINFAHVRERLRPEFFQRFVLDPPRYDSATKMPKFIADLKTSKVTTVFDGDARQQLDAIWHFIQSVPLDSPDKPPSPASPTPHKRRRRPAFSRVIVSRRAAKR